MLMTEQSTFNSQSVDLFEKNFVALDLLLHSNASPLAQHMIIKVLDELRQ